MIKLRQFNLAVLLTLASFGYANAGVIDSFNYNLAISTSTQGEVDSAGFADQGLTSPAFDITYTLTNIVDNNPTGNGTSSTDAFFGDGVLYYAEASLVSSELQLKYDFPNLIESTDLTDAGGSDSFYVDVIEIDQGFDYTITVEDINNNISTFSSVTTGAANGTRAYIAFASFTGSADFTQVTSFIIDISNTDGGLDFTLAEIGTVPEPASLAIFGLGILGLIRFQKSNKVSK